MTKPSSLLALVLAGLMLVSVSVFDPAVISGWIEGLVGVHPLQEQAEAPPDLQVQGALATITPQQLESHLKVFTSHPSRITGYPGARAAAEYIEKQFRSLGLEEVRSESFLLPVPVDRGGKVRLLDTGREFPIYGLWPNHVRTPTLPAGGLEGHLIDAGGGRLSDLDGKQLEGSVVLMDFASGDRYLDARMLGAQAILFCDQGQATRSEAEQKFLQVPVDIPRFWIEPEAAAALRAHPGRVRLESRMDWEEVEARNIIGVLPGLDEAMPLGQRQQQQVWKDQIIVLQAYYDAVSVVPALAPGAESAAGIAALLEIARLLKEQDTRYTVLFLATAGHFEGLAGINDFLYRHTRKSEYFSARIAPADRLDFRLFIGLDLSSHSPTVASFSAGTFYNPSWATDDYQKNLVAPYAAQFGRYSREVFGDSSRYLDAVAPAKRTWKNYLPVRLAFDSEAATFVGVEAITFATPNQLRERVDTPHDRLEFVDLEGLSAQARTLAGVLFKAASAPDFFNDTKLELQDWGHSLEGHVYWFDRKVNFAVPKSPVSGALVTYVQPGPNSVGGVRTLISTYTGREGAERGHFAFPIMRNRLSNRIQAFELDAEGRIVSAPDLGEEGDKTYPGLQGYGWWENRMMQVVFRCQTLSFLEVVDPRYLSALDRIAVLGGNDASPRSFGYTYVENQSAQEDRVVQAGAIFAPPGTSVKILAGDGAFGSTGALANVRYVLSNADPALLRRPLDPAEADMDAVARAQGQGYPIETGFLFKPALLAARDLWIIDDARMKQLARYGIVLEELERLHLEAKAALEEAGQRLEALDYTGYLAAVRRSLGIEARIYPEVRSTASDTVRAVIFYFALLLPFAFFCERFFFGFAEIREQLLGFAGIFIAVFLLLRWAHPAFQLSTSPYIIFLAFAILALGLLVVGIVIGRFKDLLQRRRGAASGVHETDVGRLSAGMAAVVLGISNLRKRKLRTALTAATLTLLTFTVTSFTSVRSGLDFYRLPKEVKPLYEGALVRDRAWKGMQQSTLEYVQSAFGKQALVVPRAWYLSQVQSEWAYIDVADAKTGQGTVVNGLVGFVPEETVVSGLDKLLLAGRFFAPGEEFVCILPDRMAELLGIGLEQVGQARVLIFGREYLVVGIISGAALDQVVDLDGERLTPVDSVNEASKIQKDRDEDPRNKAATAIETFNHLAAANTLLLPFQRVMAMEGRLRSVAVARFSGGDLVATVESFMARVALTLFVSQGERVVAYSSIGSTQISGTSALFIPLLIAALIVLNTMMGAVYERSREIGIYSVVGLAPSHISLLFLAEATVFAVFGAVAGYLIGQLTYAAILKGGLLGGLTLNYSSLSVVWATLIVIGTVYLSTLYPARLAANMAVPDVTRQWQFPPPEGDRWGFDFPFTVAGAEVPSIYTYLETVFAAYGEGSIGDFISREVEVKVEAEVYELSMMAWLAPYDLGISQEVRLRALPTGEHNIYRIGVLLVRRSGEVLAWQRMNRNFLNVLRKRFLVWRTLPAAIRAEYRQRAQERFAGQEVA